MRKPPIFVAIFLCYVQCLFSQPDEPNPFAHYNFNNGLSSYNSNTIVQDKDGFIWIGTINGLQRFDGHRFLTFRRNPEDKNSMTDNYIDHLMYDSRGNLWLVLGNGEVGIFDTKRFTFKVVNLKLQDQRILKLPRKLMEDSDGNVLYIFYYYEVTTYNSRRNEFSSEHNTLKTPPNWKVISLIEDSANKKYWIGTDSGLCVFNTRTRVLSYRGNNKERIPFIEKFAANKLINTLMFDRDSKFWYSSWLPPSPISRMNCYDLKKDTLLLDQQILLPEKKKFYDAKRMIQQKDGGIWLAGINVFMKFNEKEKKFQPVYNGNNERRIDYQEVNCLYEDREKNMWVSTDNNGVYIFRPSTRLFVSVKHVNRTTRMENDGSVLTLAPGRRGHILTAIWNDGLHKYNSNLESVPSTAEERKASSIWSMCLLNNKRTYWMGLDAGIMVYDAFSGKAVFHNPRLFANKLVRTIAEDKYGDIWLGLPTAGVFKWSPEKGRLDFEAGFSKVNNTPNTQIEKIMVDSKGFVWISTLMNGVYKIDPLNDSIIERLSTNGPPSKRLLDDAATDVFEYNDSIMIILTGALNIYNTSSNIITPLTSADGMPSDIVRSIEKDSLNYLWLGMFNGLCRMNLEKKSFTYYDRNDGIANDNFNYSSSCHLPDGRLAFGSTSDFVVFDPKDLTLTNNPPDVMLTDFRILNRSVSVDSLLQLPKIDLGPDQNFLTIGFSGLSYYNIKWSYYYMLEGLENEWKKASELNQANYSFLPPGKYTFKVKAENADGMSSRFITELPFRVLPPFWKSWWFYSILVLLAALMLYLIDKERMRKKEAIQRMRSNIADNLHDEVNTALNKINILSEMARIKSEKDPFKATEYFGQIHQKSHDMIIAMDDMLWSIDPANDSMEKTVERIREYIDSLKRRHDVDIDLLVDKRVETLVMNMKLRHDLFIMMKEGIRNVVQAGTKNCKIHIGIHKDVLIYTIEIDNKDCDLQQLNNLLQQVDLEKRLKEMNASLNSNMHQYTSIFELQVSMT